MKRLLSMLAMLLSLLAFAQERPFCTLNATTNPFDSPSSEQVQSLPILNGQPDLRFINEWAWWMEPLNPNWPNYVPLNNMQLSPSEPYGGAMEPINSIGFSGHYIYLNANYQEVMHPNSGWELITYNTGWYADNSTPVNWFQNSTLQSIPYLLFYNKFKGTARVFFRYANNTDPIASINYASIELYHDNPQFNLTGVLRLGNGLDKSLDQPTSITKLISRVPSPGQSELWFSTDFQIAYDPCVCSHESDLRLRFTLFTEADVELYGRAVTTTQELTSESFMNDPSYIHDFMASADHTNPNQPRNGALIYKNMSSLLDDYENRLKVYKHQLELVNQNNSEIEKLEAIIKIAQVATSVGVTAVTGMPEYSSLLSLLPSIAAMSDSPTFGSETQKAFWKALDKALGVGFELLVKDDLKKKQQPQKPQQPTVSFTEMYFSGTVTTGNFVQGYPMSTPGSKNSNQININQPSTYPLYDEALGVFALLERPKVRISEIIKDVYYWDAIEWNDPSDPDDNKKAAYKSWTVENQFQIDGPLKYYFNPALDIIDYNMQASIEVHSNRIPKSWSDNQFFSCFIDPLYTVNITSTSIEVNGFSPVRTSTGIGFNNGNNFINQISIPNTLPNGLSYEFAGATAADLQKIISTTEFIPIDAFQNSVSSIGLKNQFFRKENVNYSVNFDPNPSGAGYAFEHEIFLKIKLDISYEGFNNAGDPHEYNYVFTYQILPEDITYTIGELYPNLPGSPADITQYPENLLFNGTLFNGAPVEGCSLIGNEYFCKAYNDIQIIGDLAIANNYNVVLEAGNEIATLPTAIIPPTATLRLNSPYNFTNPMPPVSPEYLSNFCSSTNNLYKANILRSDIRATYDSLALAQAHLSISEIPFDATIFPNPSSGDTRVTISLPIAAKTSITIIDMSGKVVSEPMMNQLVQKGKTEYNMMTASLTSGIYFVNVIVNGEKKVLRFIKQ